MVVEVGDGVVFNFWLKWVLLKMMEYVKIGVECVGKNW